MNTARTGNGTAVAPLSMSLPSILTQGVTSVLFIGWVGLLLSASLSVHAQDKDAMTISPSGNVGIGSVSEAHKLNVEGNVNISGNLTISGKATAAKGTIPIGLIAMWSGDPANLPAGWVLCDGARNTPDLRGRFILGHTGVSGRYNSVGVYGGNESITMSIDQMPKHNHGGETASGSGTVTLPLTNSNSGYGVTLWYSRPTTSYSFNSGAHVHGISSEGNGAPINILPPYYVLAFIMYAGE